MAEQHSRTGLEDAISGFCAASTMAVVALAKSGEGFDWAEKMTALQHGNADGTFAAGPDDAYTVLYGVLLLTALRKIAMGAVFGPLGDALGVSAGGDAIKFRQQGWVFVYYTTAFCWGLSEIVGSAYWFDTAALWRGYPHTAAMSPTFKLYFVAQLSFWFHMVFVTLIEPWQKDFLAMIAHHAITIAMSACSPIAGPRPRARADRAGAGAGWAARTALGC